MLKKEQKHCTGDDLSFIDHHIFLCTKNTQAEIDKPAKTSAYWERKLCRSKLDIISSYGDDQAFHPKVLNFEKPWNGYRYWMAYTPYPGADQRKENPQRLCLQ